MSGNRVRIAVIGAGQIGRRHIRAIAEEGGSVVSAVVEPSPGGRAVAEDCGAPLFADVDAMLQAGASEGAIVATPNVSHAALAERLIAAGVPVLVEKPITETVESAFALADRAEAAGVPVLVGHHRRHNPIVQEAKRIVASGELGELVAVQATWLVRKPDDYFEAAAWRREDGGGPVLINLIHDIDCLRFICGEIVSVQGVASNRRRGFPVEDTAALVVTFANGAVGTIVTSDAAPSPWAWELTSGERPSYPFPRHDEDCWRLSGSLGALAVPSLRLWRHDGAQSWLTPMTDTRRRIVEEDPYIRQIAHFAKVIRREAEPLTGARDGARTLRATLAVREAARSRRPVDLPL